MHFGDSERLLFGIYTPASERRRRRGVVLCNPWGSEALRAHRTLRFFADLLAQDGLDVLRFDYSGTGDSFGDPAAARLAAWVEDATCAIDELGAVASCGRVSVVGLRLGAYVAAAAAAQLPDQVDQVVLWEPFASGADHVADLRRARPPSHRGTPESEDNLAGFELSADFRGEVERASFDGLPGAHAGVLVVHSSPDAEANGPAGLRGRQTAIERLEGSRCWVEDRYTGVGAIPVALLRRVATWLT